MRGRFAATLRPALSRARRITAFFMFVVGVGSPGFGHYWLPVETNATFKPDGTFQIDFLCDVDAALVGQEPGHVSEELYKLLIDSPAAEREQWLEEEKTRLKRTLRVLFDGHKTDFEVSFPEIGQSKENLSSDRSLPGMTARLTGAIPPGAQTFAFWASRQYGAVNLRIMREGATEAYQEIVEMSAESRPYPLMAEKPPVPTRAEVAAQYLKLGFEHILPKGLDHILFVLGLFLLGSNLKPLLFQVTAFTLAHTATLALTMLGVISLPSSVVEPLIAVSIAFVAIENAVTSELKPWRPFVVFAFGLLHGMGFAGVLNELGVPRERFLTALLTFNVGVELGQLAVIAGAFAAVGWFRRRAWYRARLAVPCSCAIALVAVYWTFERVFMMGCTPETGP